MPLRTYSGKVVYPRKPHHFGLKDTERILAAVVPPSDLPDDWETRVIRTLRQGTLKMLERLLFFLDSQAIEEFYEWAIELLDKFFGIMPEEKTSGRAKQLIRYIADRAGLSVTFN